MNKLTKKFPIRLTEEDYNLLHSLSEKFDIKPGQLARYGVRRVLAQMLKESFFVQEGE